jgi:serine/threonine-protein kinase
MSIGPGVRIGSCEILESLGAGGMGQVYRAKDTRLNRIVAVKAMHDLFAQHPERVARFEREAQLLASLNHPNIAAIHGVEEAQGSTYLVLEFVDGRPLSEILQSGAMPVPEALALAKQIADALAAAHERGIIHRDLKPGNVMVTADGKVKLLDFGLGKAIEGDPSGVADPGGPPANSPTMTMAATQAGIILGTAGYMSPEQAKGRPADKRSDVWAFGCVLYEMLTGRRAFDGEDITEILAAIVRGEPDWSALPASLPPRLQDLLRRCLVKSRADRIADMSVVQFVLGERETTTAGPATATGPLPVSTPNRPGASWALTAALVAIAVAATAGIMSLLPTAAPVESSSASGVVRAALPLPEGDEVGTTNLVPLDISPDGTTLVYVGLRQSRQQLFVRSLSDTTVKPLDGTEGAMAPFFSPDGRWIGFFAQGKLKKAAVGGTAVETLADARDHRGGSWGEDGNIYFAQTNISGIVKVPAAGGDVTVVTTPDRAKGEISHRWPQALTRDGVLLYSTWTGPGQDEQHIARFDLKTGAPHILARGGARARYVSSGHLVYFRTGNLLALPWTPSQTDTQAAVPTPLTETPRLENEGGTAFAVSSTGTLAYLQGDPRGSAHRVVWVDRSGKVEPLPLPEHDYNNVVLSPDGTRALLNYEEGTTGIWVYDFARSTVTPLVTTGGSSQAPVWTPDGKFVIYRGTRTGSRNLYMKAADGTGGEIRVTDKAEVVHSPTAVTPNGEWVIYNEGAQGAAGTAGIWKVQVHGDRTPQLVQEGAQNGQLSPDGKWLVYVTRLSGPAELYVQPFPGPGPRQQVATGIGLYHVWSKDGRQLFYSLPGQTMAVDINASGSEMKIGTPRLLYEGRFRPGINANSGYDVAKDGRFLRIQQVSPDRPATQVELALNWFGELARATGK